MRVVPALVSRLARLDLGRICHTALSLVGVLVILAAAERATAAFAIEEERFFETLL